jgi:hypothetical protein
MKYSLFYLRFRPGCWWWELVVMARKFSLALASDPRIGNTVIAFVTFALARPWHCLPCLAWLCFVKNANAFLRACTYCVYTAVSSLFNRPAAASFVPCSGRFGYDGDLLGHLRRQPRSADVCEPIRHSCSKPTRYSPTSGAAPHCHRWRYVSHAMHYDVMYGVS